MRARYSAPSVLLMLSLAADASLAVSCAGPPTDLSKAVKVTDVVTGWYDAGIVEGQKNKLVPSISFRLTNVGTAPVSSVYITVSFRQIGDQQEWGSSYLKAVGAEGLPVGSSTSPLVARSTFGYTGEQPRSQMLQHSGFVDAQVSLFAKSGSAPPVKMGEFKIERQLLTR